MPPASRGTRAETRDALITAADRLFTRRNSTSVSIDELCAEADFTRGAYYSNFSSMEEVFFAVYERRADELLERLVTHADTAPDVTGDGLTGVAETLVKAIPADFDWFALRVAFAGDSDSGEALRRHNDSFTRRILPVLAGAVQRAGYRLTGDPKEAARVISAANVGAVLQGPMSDDADQLRYDTVLATLRGITEKARDDGDGGGGAPAAVLYALDVVRGAVVAVDPRDGAVTQVVTGRLASPDGLVVDTEEGAVYVTLMGRPDGPPAAPGLEPEYLTANGAVVRIPLDATPVYGADVEQVVPTGTFTTGKQLVTDPATGLLYWCDREGRTVYRSKRDGSGLTALIATEGHGLSEEEERCVGVCVDPVNGYLYWTQKGPADAGLGRIFRAGLELPEGATAADRDDVELLWHDLPEPIDLELSADASTLYWTDRGAGPTGNTLNRAAVPAAGADGEAPEVLATGFHEAIGLALDEDARVAYVSDLSGRIRRIGLDDGSDRTVTVLPGAATGIALA